MTVFWPPRKGVRMVLRMCFLLVLMMNTLVRVYHRLQVFRRIFLQLTPSLGCKNRLDMDLRYYNGE